MLSGLLSARDGYPYMSVNSRIMHPSHHRKICQEQGGSWYEIFLLADNAQHIGDRATGPCHYVSLLEVTEMAQGALDFKRPARSRPKAHYLTYGLVKFQDK